MLMRLYDFIHGISVTYKGGFAITDLSMWMCIIGYVLYEKGIKTIYKISRRDKNKNE
ncbi:hypothetical protein G8V07_14645 [Clostridium botulinum D/C]|uniref:hypothetical protein n=1 Tax=Clostridium botulinum TaxID=1491 RepID=UPI001E56B057|nr:hypothetical protein [Clostridium botulinum]MCD3321681.1 hypothetical protein [Clostridium botulinum D/C]MCD3324962.1 hypothetical protein [Clostridium botulinum D/C]MCD3327740.1 hypothetical protein [Clostridium botulinum D/C]